MPTNITLRSIKGAELTWQEGDDNFSNLKATADGAVIVAAGKPDLTTGSVVGMTATGSAGTFAVQNPKFTKIGNQCTVWGAITCSAGGATVNITIAGFPYAPAIRTCGTGKENAVNGIGFVLDLVDASHGYLGAYDAASKTWTTSWVVEFSITYMV